MTPEEVAEAIQTADNIPHQDPKEKLKPEPVPAPMVGPTAEHVEKHISHDYKDDLAQAMNATDASVVQELLTDARDRVVFEKKERERTREKKWFSLTSFILILLALAIGGYGVYHYTHLTVPVQKPVSVGVFPSVAAVKSDSADITALIATLKANQDIKDDTPYLVPITDPTTGGLLTNQAFLSYIGATFDEPFVAQFSSIRLGILKNAATNAISTFIIGSVQDPVTATKEFLINEPNLLRELAPALAIDTTTLPTEIGTTFTQEYRYNLPYRFLSVANSADVSTQDIFYYGFATDTVVVVATDPSILKAVSGTIIRQQ